jgi:hypothetical protein
MNVENSNSKYFITALIFILLIGFSCGNKQKEAEPVGHPHFFDEPPEPTRAELVMNALHAAYPQEIADIDFRDGDWAVLMHDIWYYYCDGRLQTEDKREEISNYRAQGFYHYPAELPPFELRPVPESRARNNNTARQRVLLRQSSFMDDLWQSRNRDEAFNHIKAIRFLGKTVRVHYKIVPILARVEERILEEAAKDRTVQTWINSLAQPESWTWRNIAITESRSFHSYGVAIDLRPTSLGRLQTYWLWTSYARNDWFNVPYEERYHPPEAVIHIFEKHGFIWGGKWNRFDTMHFEYRPEILLLNGMLPELLY